MSGPNVVDKAKMVFHYVAKIAARPSNSSDIPEPNASREMKVIKIIKKGFLLFCVRIRVKLI